MKSIFLLWCEFINVRVWILETQPMQRSRSICGLLAKTRMQYWSVSQHWLEISILKLDSDSQQTDFNKSPNCPTNLQAGNFPPLFQAPSRSTAAPCDAWTSASWLLPPPRSTSPPSRSPRKSMMHTSAARARRRRELPRRRATSSRPRKSLTRLDSTILRKFQSDT